MVRRPDCLRCGCCALSRLAPSRQAARGPQPGRTHLRGEWAGRRLERVGRPGASAPAPRVPASAGEWPAAPLPEGGASRCCPRRHVGSEAPARARSEPLSMQAWRYPEGAQLHPQGCVLRPRVWYGSGKESDRTKTFTTRGRRHGTLEEAGASCPPLCLHWLQARGPGSSLPWVRVHGLTLFRPSCLSSVTPPRPGPLQFGESRICRTITAALGTFPANSGFSPGPTPLPLPGPQSSVESGPPRVAVQPPTMQQ
ncbi:uncharacterized protein LOC128568098 [Nycticebus coucang]|uniref:uncharacterized protein LOC128568098 n=1 Tax=Nycticebus coucang TaxID=9470 RepID=UPI00234D2E6B|nr:uncharacterized protein LOC128568098 [Nycticebus coucang]